MTTFSFNTGIPAANNNPSADQPIMQTNNASTKSILAVDHVTFGTAPATVGSSDGQHLQVTFNGKNAAGAQVDPLSALYTGSGTASTNADLFFRNASGIFRPNMIKAAGVFTTVAVTGAVALDMGVNISSISYNSGTQAVTVNLTAGAVNGTTVIVFINGGSGPTPGWTFAANTLTLAIVTPASSGRKMSFAILQV